MASLEQLLALQDHDTTVDQLHHRRDTLAERAELAAVTRRRDDLEVARARVQAERDDVTREQRRLEDEVASIEDKVSAVHATLYGGTVTSPRELQALQQDEDALKRHQSAVEDKVIEQMELAVPLDDALDQLASEHTIIEGELAQLEAAVGAAEAEIDAELDGVRTRRAEAAATVPDELLERYEQLRDLLGGIAVAPLAGANCGGCHLALPAAELDRIRHAPVDAIVLCPECGRLLVR
jgi:predicted  nucleic acid-binding Zn-ribbon protein